MISKRIALILLGGALVMAGTAHASAVLTHTSGKVKIGVNDEGHLNIPGVIPSVSGTTEVGMRYLPNGVGAEEYEVTSHGCLCEGWGVSYTGDSGSANIDGGFGVGVDNLSLVSFVSDGVTATSVVDMGNLRITHEFMPSPATDNLYEAVVTIEAFRGPANDVRYRRTMDWDTDPIPFSELVTIGGTAAATAVLGASDDGFCSSDPTDACGSIVAGGIGDFVDLGPDDHGANFDFTFGDLAVEEFARFSIFYGGADSVRDAFAVMAAAGIEVYSLGRSGRDVDGDGFGDAGTDLEEETTPTYIFGFKGVGGEPVPTVPEPATVSILGLGLLALGLGRKRRS